MSTPSDEAATSGVDVLPPRGVLLHIGPYKTGSTAIQSAMHAAREAMAEHGVLYPGPWRRAMRPGWAVLGYTPRGRDAVPMEVWDTFAAGVRDTPGRACVSTEDFGSAGPAYAAKITEDLGRDRVHVLAVARRLDRLLPSQWQERVKSHDTLRYDEWLERVLGDDEGDREWRRFWASHDVVRMADRWEPSVGRDRFLLVVTDDSDRGLVPRTFEQLLGLPDGLLHSTDSSNAALSANGTELLRRLNEVAAEQEWPDRLYHTLVQRGMVLQMIAGPRPEGEASIPTLPGWAATRVAELSAQRVEQLRERAVRVVGDLEQYAVAPAAGDEADTPDTVSLDTAVRALAGMIDASVAQLTEEQERTERKLRRIEARKRRAGKQKSPQVADTSSRALLAEAGRRVAGRLRRGRSS